MESISITSAWRQSTTGHDYSPSASARDDGRVAIVVFARLPTPGRVKTRLAAGPGVGPEGACRFYRACAEHIIQQAASCSHWAHVTVYHSSADVTSEVAAWLQGEGLAMPCVPQLRGGAGPAGADGGGGGGGGGSSAVSQPDLGAKMLHAMAEARARSGARKVLITGTDIPDLSSQLLATAAAALDEHDMVVGPCLDGGYYLLGLTQLEKTLFEDMPWSTDSVLRETLSRAAAAGRRMAPLSTLPRLRDVDTLQDLRDWLTERDADTAVAVTAPSPSDRRNQQEASEQLGLLKAGNVDEMAKEGEASEAGNGQVWCASRSLGCGELEGPKEGPVGSGGCQTVDLEHQAVLRLDRLLQVSREVVDQATGVVGISQSCC